MIRLWFYWKKDSYMSPRMMHLENRNLGVWYELYFKGRWGYSLKAVIKMKSKGRRGYSLKAVIKMKSSHQYFQWLLCHTLLTQDGAALKQYFNIINSNYETSCWVHCGALARGVCCCGPCSANLFLIDIYIYWIFKTKAWINLGKECQLDVWGIFGNGNVNWCRLVLAFLCRTRHFCVEPGILLSSECYNCLSPRHPRSPSVSHPVIARTNCDLRSIWSMGTYVCEVWIKSHHINSRKWIRAVICKSRPIYTCLLLDIIIVCRPHIWTSLTHRRKLNTITMLNDSKL